MSEIVISLLVILGTAVLVGGLFLYLAYRKRQKEARLVQAAREHGWELEHIQQPMFSGFILKGKTAHGHWSLEVLTEASPRDSGPGSSSISHRTRWRCQDISLPDRAIVIGPLPAGANPGALQSFGVPLLQLALRKMIGEDADWVSGLSQVTPENKALAAKFLCLANEDQDLSRLLSLEVENILLKLPEKNRPVIKLRSTGLEISLPTAQLSDPSELEAMIHLGKALLSAWQG
ncbi:MAG: hypothetical protein HPY59_17055 [Anaerolineae bacterium]|nr:hypothetical protein [Anaerolineae bacterium]